jgi:hypothetical protein
LGYIVSTKRFVGRKPQTTYSKTLLGEKAFKDHLMALEAFIRQNL